MPFFDRSFDVLLYVNVFFSCSVFVNSFTMNTLAFVPSSTSFVVFFFCFVSLAAFGSTIFSSWFGWNVPVVRSGLTVCRLACQCNIFVMLSISLLFVYSWAWIWFSYSSYHSFACHLLLGRRQHWVYMCILWRNLTHNPCSYPSTLLNFGGLPHLVQLYVVRTWYPRHLELFSLFPLWNQVKDDSSITLLLPEILKLSLNMFSTLFHLWSLVWWDTVLSFDFSSFISFMSVHIWY